MPITIRTRPQRTPPALALHDRGSRTAAASERVLWGRHRPACITTRDVIGGLQENLTDIQALSVHRGERLVQGLSGGHIALADERGQLFWPDW